MFRGTFAVVNLQAITRNVENIIGLLGPETKLLVAVKAAGYGHGIVQAAQAVIQGGGHALGVASLEEGMELRKAGITAPVLVFGRVPVHGLPVAARHRIAVTMTSNWEDEGLGTCDPPLDVHIKLDTGMSRLGYQDPAVAVNLAKWIESRSDLRFAGLYSHLACADAQDAAHLTAQVARFDKALRVFEQHGLRPPAVHLANSAGTFRNKALHHDMVRVGVSAYGYPPSPDFPLPIPLQPALSLFAQIQRLAFIDIGETVSYGATFTAKRKTLVATVPVGYADGYFRVLSNQSQVYVRGQLAPVIGNVCMDQLMVDVTDVLGIQNGDWVTLYGQAAPDEWNQVEFLKHPETEITKYVEATFAKVATQPAVVSLDTLARLAGTISYELMCALSERVPRIYFHG
ncbi:alanine racemase [Alicyclobacillus ferrooxydans]|uniref:Alanine racemase n=1 Tax=Alicyclobacillus ferrooxydans TaxID=471514 RepID=A0A0N8PPQ6_9BACL|nr:alanine racemase [Alicyclobacillus ferrooxydans]KPV44989.1 hypothetical protein AN477_04250 [Alicyclobacillus ferrooxydans]